MREFKKLYGLIKYRSRKDIGVVPVDDAAPPNGRSSDVSLDKDR
jgi:mitochondrial chaperone BCS1